MSDFFLGVDGGQSGTVAVIGDAAGRIVSWATAGPCNHVAAAEARDKFLRVMRECLTMAAHRAGLNLETTRFRAACLGMSGGPEDKSALLHELISAERMIVTHDGRIALAGAMNGGPGVIAIAGTGSIAYGENERGESARAGGWGYVFGDEGSGFDIVRHALRAILREHEGWGPRTALTPALLESTETANANEMLHLLYKPEWPRSRAQRAISAGPSKATPSPSTFFRALRRTLRCSQRPSGDSFGAKTYHRIWPGSAAFSTVLSCSNDLKCWLKWKEKQRLQRPFTAPPQAL